jgi:hypothetical protein
VVPARPRATFVVSHRVLRVFSSHRRVGVFRLRRSPLCELLFSSKRLLPVNRTRMRVQVHLSWGFVPYSVRQKQAPVFPGGIPASGTFRPRRFPRPRRLPSPATLRGLFHPRYARGVHPDLDRSRPAFRPEQGDRARGPSPRRSPRPRRARFRVLSSLALRRKLPARGAVAVISAPVRERRPPSGRHRVSIAGESVFLPVASQEHRPS